MIFSTEEEETDQPHLLGPLDEGDPPLMVSSERLQRKRPSSWRCLFCHLMEGKSLIRDPRGSGRRY